MQSTSIFELFSNIDRFVTNNSIRPIIHSLIGSRVIDCIHYLPIKNIETLFCTKWGELKQDDNVIIQIYIKKHYNSYKIRGAPYKISGLFDNKLIYLVFFSKYTGYLKKIYPENENILISGKIDTYKNKFQITHPNVLDKGLSFGRKKEIKVFYKQKKGIKSEKIEKIIHNILIKIPNLAEWNENIFNHYEDIPSWKVAITNIHKPAEITETRYNSKSYLRLAYDELLATQISLGIVRNRIKDKHSNNYKDIAISELVQLTKKLSFDLTKDQKIALLEIISDLKEKKRMMRLLHGDVGSGKTIVALLSALFVIRSGYQVAIMVPTEILAQQHFKLAQKLFNSSNIKPGLLIASTNNKKEIYNNISSGSIQLIIGTQSLIQEKLEFHNLSYVIIDEQHRFGVNQRLKFRDKGKNVDMLLLSATPIPRTMLLAALGDINLTTIKKKPFNNNINTIIKSEDNIDEVILYLNTFLTKNKKVFWVCPMISDEDDTKSSIMSRFKILKKRFKKVDILHGKLNELQKQRVLDDFKSGKTNLLVCTIVIEVGIDIPDANIILIDQAEMFGMAQIHQLRGRVGRGRQDGICILLYKNTLKEYGYQRLLAVKATHDGFDIAEKDLNLRGGGDIQDKKQYGYRNFLFFNIYEHKALVDIAISEAHYILKKDPELKTERGKRIINLLYIFEKNKAVDLISAG